MEDYKKKYEDALERAKVINPGTADYEVALKIFPELKESKDERIRKELIEYLNERKVVERLTDTRVKEEWISWLEKQGASVKLSEEEQNSFAKGVLSSCAMSFINYLDAHKYEGKMCVSNGECEDIENAFHNTMWDRLHKYYCKYIEKQGEKRVNENNEGIPLSEQKPTDKVEPKFKIGDCIRHKGSDESYRIVTINDDYYFCENNHVWGITSQDYFELVEQKPADNKPKFHEGDWITIDNPCKIISIDGNYIVQYCDDEKTREISKKFCESCFHLWTLQDVKDGDVLTVENMIFVYKTVLASHVVSYCKLFNNKFEVFNDVRTCCEANSKVHPATKEQRDILFKKMKEAGYEWDAEKKELKKIEQKPVWSEEDERLQ